MRISPPLAAIVFLTIATGAAQAAGAANKATNRPAMEKAAKKACITGDVSKGIDLLGDLYVETNDPTYVYNQGRCFEQNHRWEEAVDRFREYARKVPDLTAKDRAEVDGHIADCEAQHAKLAPPPVVAAPLPLVAPTPAPSPAAVNLTATSAPAAAERSGSRLRTAGIVTASVGVVALAGGMVCNLHANSLASDLDKPTGWDRGKASSRDTYETLSWIGYGVGAAALATGATLFFVGGRSNPTADASTTVALTPVLLPGFASLSLRGSY
jgi:hypothetical protein